MSQPKKQTKKKKPHEPELLEKSYMEGSDNKRVPYIYFAFIAFVILSFIWKAIVRVEPEQSPQEPRTISEREVATPKDLMH